MTPPTAGSARRLRRDRAGRLPEHAAGSADPAQPARGGPHLDGSPSIGSGRASSIWRSPKRSKIPSGAITFHYGDCLQGGGNTCVTPLRVISSPDNSFLPAGSAPVRTVSLRGRSGAPPAGGRTIEIPTGAVVVDVEREDARPRKRLPPSGSPRSTGRRAGRCSAASPPRQRIRRRTAADAEARAAAAGLLTRLAR